MSLTITMGYGNKSIYEYLLIVVGVVIFGLIFNRSQDLEWPALLFAMFASSIIGIAIYHQQ